ncbi:hypothetical protein GCM10009618_04910 [Nesterenkonia lacusekhoensis]
MQRTDGATLVAGRIRLGHSVERDHRPRGLINGHKGAQRPCSPGPFRPRQWRGSLAGRIAYPILENQEHDPLRVPDEVRNSASDASASGQDGLGPDVTQC